MDRKKVTGRTDQGTKEFPGDEAYKKLFAKMLEEDKEKEKKKLEQSNKKKEKEEDKEKKSIQQAIKKNYQSIRRLDGSFKKAIARIGKLEKTVAKQQKKTTKIISVLKTGKSNIGEKLPGSTGNELQKSLVETNKVLVDIFKQMQLQSALEDKERRKLKQKEQIERSKKRLSAKESELEKTSKKLGEETKKKSEKMMSPIKGILDDLLEFILLIGAGIATNAVFEWLKDDKNRQKIDEWFGWIKDHWKWVLAGLGAIALIPVITTIASLVTTFGSLISLAAPLFAFLTNPITLTLLATLAGTLALGKAMEWGIDMVQKATYGEGNVKKGIFATKLGDHYGRIASKKDQDAMTKEEKSDAIQIALYDQLLKSRQSTNDALYRAKENLKTYSGSVSEGAYKKQVESLEAQLKFKDKSISDTENQTKIQGSTIGELFDLYSSTGVLPSTTLSKKLYKRETGGPVTSKTPYLVGEGGPEIFMPNVNGSIMSNYRTEKIYDMISSDMGQGGINMINLPPITNQMPTPEVQVPSGQATDVPEISSINMADPYRQLSPMLYGITV